MNHHILGVQTQQHVRKNRIIEDSFFSLLLMLLLVLAFPPSVTSRSMIMSTKGICDSQSAGISAHGQTLAAIDLHEAAEKRTFAQIVLGRIVGRNFLELGMNTRAVVTLRIVFEH